MTEAKAPLGWSKTTMGNLGKYINGRGFKKSEWRSAGRPIIRIQNLTGSSDIFNYYDGEVEGRHVVSTGDLLISWAATLGSYFWNGPEGVLNQHIFRVESAINNRFHKHLIDYKLAEMYASTHGSGMVHITRSKFDALEVLIPPPHEQQRIVEILENHLSRLDKAAWLTGTSLRRTALLDESAIVRELGVGEHVAGIVSGNLPNLERGWRWRTLGELADVVGGVTKDAKKQSDPSYAEMPYLRVANVQRARLDLQNVTTIRVSPAKAKSLRLVPGDVLMNEGGDRDKLARGWVWEGQIEGCIHQNHVFRARPFTAMVRPEWLAWCANTYGARWAQRHGRQSVNLASISLKAIKSMPIPVAPLEIQDGRLISIRDRIASTTRLRREIEQTQKRAASLHRSLLSAAFSGQLTGSSSYTERIEELAEAGV